MSIKKLVFGLLALGVSFFSMGQEKLEREYSINADEVHVDALQFIENSKFRKKVRWYKELGLDEETYEAKVKYKKALYSIEFDLEGEIEDIEKLIKTKHIPQELRTIIARNIEEELGVLSILKIQLQWFNGLNTFQEIYANHDRSFPPFEGLELIVEDKSFIQYEVQTDAEGAILSLKKIINRPTDNLDF